MLPRWLPTRSGRWWLFPQLPAALLHGTLKVNGITRRTGLVGSWERLGMPLIMGAPPVPRCAALCSTSRGGILPVRTAPIATQRVSIGHYTSISDGAGLQAKPE